MHSAGGAYHKALALFPNVLCEPLEHHYLSLRGLGALDELFFKDALFGFSWRGAAWAAWLAALCPRQEFRRHLVRRRPSVPHQQYVVDLALAAIDGERPESLRESLELVDDIRASIVDLPWPHIPLRRAPDAFGIEQMKKERDELRLAYRVGGVKQVRAQLSNTQWGYYYSLSYKEWRQRGCPPQPTPPFGA